jgi:Mn-dependent DtxR family transcriptional regulator
MPTPDESKILKIIEAEGGECSVGRIAIKMRLEPNYVRVILRSMGEDDIVDIFRSGRVRIADKGCVALGKKPKAASDGFKRYLEDRAKWKTF